MDFNESGAAFPLDQAPPGSDLVVDRVESLDSPALRRLLDLGVLPGTHVRVIRRAPMGDPVVYELRGYRLCLRRSESAHVFVRWSAAAGDTERDTGRNGAGAPRTGGDGEGT